MFLHLFMYSFPAWVPHFSFLRGGFANEMIVLRWLHLIFGIIWIGLLYFFNLVLTPAMKECDPKLRINIYPELMPRLPATLGSLANGSAGGFLCGSWPTCSFTRCSFPQKES